MPHFDGRSSKGDLFVEYNVILPLEVSPETRRSKSLHTARVADIDDFPPSLELIEAFQPLSSTHDEL
jgi:DnaJ-related protein SCJ1